jgi:hypothetical protein
VNRLADQRYAGLQDFVQRAVGIHDLDTVRFLLRQLQVTCPHPSVKSEVAPLKSGRACHALEPNDRVKVQQQSEVGLQVARRQGVERPQALQGQP